MTGNPIFLNVVIDEFARAVTKVDFERAEQIATIAFGVQEARRALEQLEERSARRKADS